MEARCASITCMIRHYLSPGRADRPGPDRRSQQAQPAQTVQDRAQRRQLAQVELARPVGRYPGDHRGAFGQHVREGGIGGQDACR